ncbi:TPA: hypothetical protein ACIBFG_004329 [Salmonella enterica subsp. enterica serovar Bahrenfeld]
MCLNREFLRKAAEGVHGKGDMLPVAVGKKLLWEQFADEQQ